MVTYNHEKYIDRAIESVLAQRVAFPIELVVGEDCSTDSTRHVVAKYCNTHPDKVRLLCREQNLGASRNFVSTLRACRGDYIACLEGDDYWIAPDKLEKQVQFLDANQDFAACGHRVRECAEDGSLKDRVFPAGDSETADLGAALRQCVVRACSLVFRNRVVEYPAWMHDTWIGDWPLLALLAAHGPIRILPDCMSAYRVHSGGIWSGSDSIRQCKEVLKMLGYLNDHFDRRYDAEIRASMLPWMRDLAHAQYEAGQFREAHRSFLSCGRNIDSAGVCRMLATYLPRNFLGAARGLRRRLRVGRQRFLKGGGS